MERYLPTHRMRDLLADNSLLLPALSRFGISLGFGDSTVGDVCSTHSVDCHTFLAVANFISGKPFDPTAISPRTLMGYLKNAHTYFLDYVLPNIRRRLLEAISSGTQTDVTLVILKFYDEYVGEVRRHMEYENTHVFTYVESLLEGRQTPSGFSIARFKDNHHPIAAKLKEIKEILICHFTADSARVDMLNSLLFDIVICERDLIAHCRVEDSLFIPAIEALENQAASAPAPATGDTAPAASTGLDANGDILLTPPRTRHHRRHRPRSFKQRNRRQPFPIRTHRCDPPPQHLRQTQHPFSLRHDNLCHTSRPHLNGRGAETDTQLISNQKFT